MTPNPFHALAQALEHRGDDLEDIARDLAYALKEVIFEGLGSTDHKTVLAEVALLMNYTNDKTHRPGTLPVKPDPDQF